jgi:hypothetical protein
VTADDPWSSIMAGMGVRAVAGMRVGKSRLLAPSYIGFRALVALLALAFAGEASAVSDAPLGVANPGPFR